MAACSPRSPRELHGDSGPQAATGGADEGSADEGAVVSAREARLGRAVEQLRRRLEQSRAEVAQLEALLRDADAQATGEAVCVWAVP